VAAKARVGVTRLAGTGKLNLKASGLDPDSKGLVLFFDFANSAFARKLGDSGLFLLVQSFAFFLFAPVQVIAKSVGVNILTGEKIHKELSLSKKSRSSVHSRSSSSMGRSLDLRPCFSSAHSGCKDEIGEAYTLSIQNFDDVMALVFMTSGAPCTINHIFALFVRAGSTFPVGDGFAALLLAFDAIASAGLAA
jgi:hypothetical protein